MDIRIQGEMDGTATALVLRERFNIPVIYLTAHVDSATVERAKHTAPLGYITKPFQETALHASIEIALHRIVKKLKSGEKRELLASTLRAISEGVIAVDRQRTITLFNPAAEAWTGRSSGEALGQPVERVFHTVADPSGDQISKPWEQALSERFAAGSSLRAPFCYPETGRNGPLTVLPLQFAITRAPSRARSWCLGGAMSMSRTVRRLLRMRAAESTLEASR